MPHSETIVARGGTPRRRRRRRRRRQAAVVLALITVATWTGWLGWDTHYDVDPATGAVSGPYQAWQVVGCGTCLVVVTALAVRWLRPAAIAVTVSSVCALLFAVNGYLTTDDGLYPVGAFLVFIGLLAAGLLVAHTATALRPVRRRPDR